FGITVTVGPFLARASFKHKNKLRLLRAYRVFPQSGDFILREHTEYRWVYPEEIEGLMFAPSDLKLLPELKKHLER
ncbi:CTP pyrophosphohydrolase, partial [Treponema sp. OttesenSCG-928-L16]|nr:CTP pyrophosphohydrolase [Treponema sp. OttesenSCG-928-L16]